MYVNPQPSDEGVKDIIGLLENVVDHKIPLTDGLRRGIWTWIQANPTKNPLILYKEIVKHPNPKIRAIELGWPPAIQADIAEDESAEKQAESPNITHEYIKPVGMMFQ